MSTVCGPESTSVTVLVENSVLKQVPKMDPLTVGVTYENSNSVCPVKLSLASGGEWFSLADKDPDFSVTLSDDANEVEGLYSYQISAEAEGGAAA